MLLFLILYRGNHHFFSLIAVSSSNGRARSDPTHQHLAHPQVHSHSAHQGPSTVPYTTMECESPASQSRGSQQTYQQPGWTEHSSRPSNGGLSHSQSHRHHTRAHVQHHHQSPPTHIFTSHHPNHSESMRPSFPVSNLQGTNLALDIGQAQLGMPVPVASYSSEYGQFSQQTWPTQTFPFSIATQPAGSIASHDSGNQRGRSGTERSEDSPMVGVCVQQSPVASH